MRNSPKSFLLTLLAASAVGGLLGCDIDHRRHHRHYGWYDTPGSAPGWGRSGPGYYGGSGPYTHGGARPYYDDDDRGWGHRRSGWPW